MSASYLKMINYATQRVAKALAEAPHRQIIEIYRITAMQKNNMWSIALKACAKEILTVVY
jgi:hypothetical protein